jgi:C-terminal processing protease CtpA/Prc
MITWSFCMGLYRKQLSDIAQNGISGDIPSSEIDLIASILETYSYYDLEEEEMLEAAIKAYVAATGDRYAAYMNKEEFASYNASMTGSTVGIGINVIESVVQINGVEIKVYKVINVTKGSPAEAAGVLTGDLIAYIGTGTDVTSSVDHMGYEEAFAKMIGEEGTKAEFTVLRKKAGTQDQYEEKFFSAVRKKIVSSSVYSHVCQTDNTVGIVKITGFDYNTPAQFSEAVDALRAK